MSDPIAFTGAQANPWAITRCPACGWEGVMIAGDPTTHEHGGRCFTCTYVRAFTSDRTTP